MPIRNAPSKVKVVTYLTPIEKVESELFAQSRGLSLSEWIRQAAVHALENAHAINIPPAPRASNTTHTPLPTARDLLSDYQFGDLSDPSLVEDKEG